jgi:hypothetical protein
MEPPECLDLPNAMVPDASNSIKTYLERINTVIWNATGENDLGIRNEGGRINVSLVKTFHRKNAPQFAQLLLDSGAVTLMVQIVTGSLLSQSPGDSGLLEIDEESQVKFDAPIGMEQVFLIVQNEGLVALAMLCALCPSAMKRTALFRKHLIYTFKNLLADEKERKQLKSTAELKDEELLSLTRLNVCQLLLILCKTDGCFFRVS